MSLTFVSAVDFGVSGISEQHIVYVLVFFAAIFLPLAVWRTDRFADRTVPTGDWNRLPGLFKALWRPAFLLETTLGDAFARIFSRTCSRYAELAEISALPLTGRRVFVCKFICMLLFGAFGSILFFFVPTVPEAVVKVAVAVLAILGWMMPSLSLSAAAQLRQEEITRALPFAIDLIGAAMRSGLEFGAAMRYYVGSGEHSALVDEFARVLGDATLGLSIPEGLAAMAKRIKIKSFTAFAGVVSYGTEIGASISDTLKVQGEEMRRERFAIAEQKAARAPALMIFPIAMFILPAVFLIIFVPVMLQFAATQAM